jgi:outer membrane protein assembly factor BamA
MMRAAGVLVAALLSAWSAASAQAPPPGEPAQAQGQGVAVPERLAEVRVHGNHTTPDVDVLRIAGLTVGQPVDAAAIEAAREQLSRSGRFEDAEIRQRYRSLEPGGDVVLVIVVREHPVAEEVPGSAAARPFKRLFASGMFLPILNYTDGYGFTYGARFSFVDLLGRNSRISIPLTWGGTRRAAMEVERTFQRGPFDRIFGGAAIWQRTNPFYEQDETRREAWVEGSRRIAGPLRASGHLSYADIAFGSTDDDALTYGASVSVDTRIDPVFPRNAVFASAGWERLDPTGTSPVNRFEIDARAFRGLIGQAVLSFRVQYAGADGPQPEYARYLLGGAGGGRQLGGVVNGTLRGYRAGSFSGDNLLGASAELRVPLSSPMNFAKAGITLFADAGKTWDYGQPFDEAEFKAGGGAGFFLLASIFQLNLDMGFREGWGTRVHFTTGLQF